MGYAIETYGLAALILGGALIVGAAVWLLVRAFRERVWWGLGCLLVIPAPVFVYRHWVKAKSPVWTALLGVLIIAGTVAFNRWYVDLGPREKLVDGELHITLTGWDRDDYSLLQSKPETIVLQMANPDVTDDTLICLRHLPKLRELDLNETRITDAGLAVLAELPQLESLRLRKTAITEQGFREHLFDKDLLRELDLRDTQVASKTVREWRQAQPGRKALR